MFLAVFCWNSGDVSFKWRENKDFDWLQSLGKVFIVFDQLDSGIFCTIYNGSLGEGSEAMIN
ncbi:hypothetical protein PASE110613_05110 [Paenibacillus sediminis]|uniref:Uncharacterized protein n=1 Tax=Paenibacillus sediminis TaxID=664909 RepID=A0ABS4H0U7_9BACL|nr:hypothetical protein [Paenibacillus sediminis]